MTHLSYAPQAQRDFERIALHLSAHDVVGIAQRVDEIVDALEILTRHPHIGRPAAQGRRELVIGRGSRGYVALYRYLERDDEIFVLALRSQREAGFDEA